MQWNHFQTNTEQVWPNIMRFFLHLKSTHKLQSIPNPSPSSSPKYFSPTHLDSLINATAPTKNHRHAHPNSRPNHHQSTTFPSLSSSPTLSIYMPNVGISTKVSHCSQPRVMSPRMLSLGPLSSPTYPITACPLQHWNCLTKWEALVFTQTNSRSLLFYRLVPTPWL